MRINRPPLPEKMGIDEAHQIAATALANKEIVDSAKLLEALGLITAQIKKLRGDETLQDMRHGVICDEWDKLRQSIGAVETSLPSQMSRNIDLLVVQRMQFEDILMGRKSIKYTT